MTPSTTPRLSILLLLLLFLTCTTTTTSAFSPLLPQPPKHLHSSRGDVSLYNKALPMWTGRYTVLLQASKKSSTSSSSSLPKRVRKKRNNKSKFKSGPLTEQDLADHVSNLYIHGPGGVLRDTEVRRQRRQAALHSSSSSNNDTADNKASNPNLEQTRQQLASLRNLDRHPALLLNANYQPMSWLPLSLWNWQEAVKAVFSGKVTVVDVYPDVTIRAANLEVPLPAVIALTEYVPTYHQTPAFTKRNVFLRDEYRCQYCNDAFHTRDLSLDHVVPRCKGGRLSWDNAVTSCRTCNGRKGSYDVKEIRQRLGMQLLKPPRTPTQYELAATASRMLPRRVHPTWEPYLGVVHKKKKKHPKTQTKTLQHHQHSRQAAAATREDEA